MDCAVLAAYGWSDIIPTCDFFLDYEVTEDEVKPYRYRWPDEFRDEVLSRLLELNSLRAEGERLAGVAILKIAKGKRVSKLDVL